VSDKSSHSSTSKGSGKSLKEKRAEKKAADKRATGSDAVAAATKR
jgi:hypothetical protein